MTGTGAVRHGADRDGRGRPVLLAAAGAVLLVALGGVAFLLTHRSTGSDTAGRPVASPPGPAASAAAGAAPSSGPSAAAAGASPGVRPRQTAPVRDGDLEFTVTGIRTGVGPLGDGAQQRRPTGQFVLVTVEVRNRGDQPAVFDFGSQLLDDAKGRQFDADDEAGSYLEQARPFEDPVGPGRAVTGVLVFDLPKDAVPTSVDLHGPDSLEGVSVPLA